MKANKKELLLTSAVCLLPLLAGVILYPRLPETMATHWGFTWVAVGLLMVVSAFWQPHGPSVTVVLLALAVGIPVLYSYLYYRRHEKGGAQ